ncbi:hypothetical protein MJL30_38775, partial [Salmonella enterica subsp. enterica serovar Anatum]|nr:hypothetical protein [Salmonella enterica subsp. enterica serovar Anatum]
MLRVYHSNRLDVLEALMEFIVERERLEALIEIAGYDKKVSYPAGLTDSNPISAAPSGQKSLKPKTVQQV